jgi:hypothetical protein
MKKRNPDEPSPARRKRAQPRATQAGPAPKTSRLKIPPILLEGDDAPPPAAGGPGQRYALGPTPPAARAAAAESPLPEAYGTQQLFLTARDPHWLYAHWDMTAAQLKKYNSLSTDGHLVLRIHRGAPEAAPLSEIHVHPQSRNWFVPVPEAGAKYWSALGYYDAARRWVGLACSGATLTPAETLSEETTLRFATIPADVPFAQLVSIVKKVLPEHAPLAEALEQLRAHGYEGLPEPEEIGQEWTPDQDLALAEVVLMDPVRRVWVGSLEITELVRRQLGREVSSIGAPFGLPAGALGGVSSPFGVAGPRGFWFNINAELIIYGATEPDATVTIGDRPIQLRPDGSFSFRFALPDGEYSLPAVAQSADGGETREARLQFSRSTAYQGEVGAHPQEELLPPPLATAVA